MPALSDLISAISRLGLVDRPTTTKQRLVTPLLIFASPLMDAEPFVKAAGLPEQSGFSEFGPLLVTPAIVIKQTAPPAFITPLETLMVDGAVNATVALQPAPDIDDVAPGDNRNPLGSVSIKAIPD